MIYVLIKSETRQPGGIACTCTYFIIRHNSISDIMTVPLNFELLRYGPHHPSCPHVDIPSRGHKSVEVHEANVTPVTCITYTAADIIVQPLSTEALMAGGVSISFNHLAGSLCHHPNRLFFVLIRASSTNYHSRTLPPASCSMTFISNDPIFWPTINFFRVYSYYTGS